MSVTIRRTSGNVRLACSSVKTFLAFSRVGRRFGDRVLGDESIVLHPLQIARAEQRSHSTVALSNRSVNEADTRWPDSRATTDLRATCPPPIPPATTR